MKIETLFFAHGLMWFCAILTLFWSVLYRPIFIFASILCVVVAQNLHSTIVKQMAELNYKKMVKYFENVKDNKERN